MELRASAHLCSHVEGWHVFDSRSISEVIGIHTAAARRTARPEARMRRRVSEFSKRRCGVRRRCRPPIGRRPEAEK